MGAVCHPSVFLGTIETSLPWTNVALWENHDIHIVCFLHWTRALVYRERVQLAAGAIGCQLRAGVGGLLDMEVPTIWMFNSHELIGTMVTC